MKGSSFNREVLSHLKIKDIKKTPTKGQVLKDLDFIRLRDPLNFFDMRESDRHNIIQIIQRDVNFLMQEQFMDYSLLLAVKKVNQAFKREQTDLISSLRSTFKES